MNLIAANLVLENERVLMRRLVAEDEQYLVPFAETEPGLWHFSLQSAATKDGMRRYIADAIADYDRGYSFPFIVYDKQRNAYAGATRFYDINASQQSVQIGYTWYGRDFQGTGLNKNCKFLLLNFAFETLGCERVEFRADATNQRSIAAMKSIGCIEEGILRSHLNKSGGGRRDSIILSILQNEWFNMVKPQLGLKIKNLL